MKWRVFPLHTDIPDQGLGLDELFKKKGMLVDVDKAVEQLQSTARQYGLEIGKRKMTYNSRLAQEVGLWAQDQGCGHAFHMAAFEAYFVHGKNIAQQQVLLDIVSEAGLSPDQGRQIIETRSYSDTVDRDWALAGKIGISAVPTFRMGTDMIVGARPHVVMERMVEKYVPAGSFFPEKNDLIS